MVTYNKNTPSLMRFQIHGDYRGGCLLGKSATDFSEIHAICYLPGRIRRQQVPPKCWYLSTRVHGDN